MAAEVATALNQMANTDDPLAFPDFCFGSVRVNHAPPLNGGTTICSGP